MQMANADGAVLSGVNLNEAIIMCTTVSWHCSYPWATAQSTQRFSGSIVVLYDGDGHSFVGLFRAAMDTTRTWGVGQQYLGMIHRLEHEMNRPEDYDYLLVLCRSEIPTFEASDLLVQWLWKMWGISLRECSQSVHVHKRNKSFIRKELQGRGIALHPDSGPVVRLPAGSLWTVIDVKRGFRETLVVSYIPLCVCDFLLDKLRVIRLEPPPVGSGLDNGRSWARRINNVEVII